jgi:hypothetical protein
VLRKLLGSAKDHRDVDSSGNGLKATIDRLAQNAGEVGVVHRDRDNLVACRREVSRHEMRRSISPRLRLDSQDRDPAALLQ